MKALQDKKWQPIPIAEEFNSFESGKSGGLNHLTQTTNEGIPYVSATNRNNGTSCFVKNDKYSRSLLQKGNCIGFIKNGDGSAGYAIYKKEQFISTSDVLFGYTDWLTPAKGLFFIACQDKIQEKYSHGYKRNRQHLAGDKVMLPVNENGEPDYAFMETYVSDKMGGLIMRYKAFLKSQLSELEHKNIPALGEKEWKPFHLSEIAECIHSTAYHSENLNFGETSKLTYVTRTANQNGIYGFVEDDAIFNINPANSISFGAETAEFFYRPSEYITGNKMYYITFQQLNVFTGQFFITCLRKSLKDCFSYGNGAIPSRVMRKPVMLPITSTGEPDWDYMEQYSINLMLKKYEQYLEFLKGQKL